MQGPRRTALAAFALGLGALFAGAPAQALAAQTVEPPLADAPPAGDPAGDAPLDDLQTAERPSRTVTQMAGWVVNSGDSGGRPFAIVDKAAANVFIFDPDGSLQGAAPVLLGLARGDDTAAGVGDRDLAAVRPDERTTPAGRFVASFGAAAGDRRVLWVDYADAISMHPVVTTNPKERRLERLESPLPQDRRITYGCINVPTAFYRDVVLKAFEGGGGVVYVLPDTKPLQEVFPAFAALVRASAARNGTAANPGAQPLAASDSPR